MKNKMMKLMGIVLTLAILAGLLMTVVPVSAGNLSWDFTTPPSATTTTFQLTQNTQTSLFAIAPDGKTVFAWDKNAGELYKSGDGGVTWTITNVGAGLNYSTVNNGTNITGNLPVVALAVSPNYATDTTILAATANNLYASTNGGQSFLLKYLAPVTLSGSIVSIAISPYYISTGGTAMLVATSSQVNLYSDDYGWRTITGATFPANSPSAGNATNFAPGQILAAKFSPTYQSDGEILAVVSGVQMGTMTTQGTVVETLFANSPWNATVQPANLISTSSVQVGNVSTNNIIANSSTATASFAFPSDYSSSSSTLNRVYVTIGDSSATGTNSPGDSGNVVSTGFDVWRINGSINSSGSVVNATQLKLTDATSPANNASLAYTGTTASGTLVVGEYGTGGVWYNTTPNGGTTWTQASSSFVPGTNVGRDVFLTFPASTGANPTTLYAATNNNLNAGWGSAFFSSTDYNSFSAKSLISVANLNNIGLSQPSGAIKGSQDQYMMVSYTQAAGAPPLPVSLGDVQMIFKSTDSGATWAEVFGLYDTVTGINDASATSGVGQALANIYVSPTYATDNTVYVPQSTNTIWKTTDGGKTWNSIVSTTPNNSISSFGLIDANTYWLGSTAGGIYKSGSYTQIATLDGKEPFQIFNLPFGVVVNTYTGEVYISTDNGATFTRLGNFNQFGAGKAALTFDVPNKTIYGANGANTNNTLYKWTVGTDTAWINWCSVTYTYPGNTTQTPQTPTALSSISLASDGTLYIRVPNDVNANAGFVQGTSTLQLLRCVNLTSAPQGQQTFVGIPGTDSSSSDFGNGIKNLPGGKTTWITTDTTAQTNTIYQIITNVSTTQTGYPALIKSYVDTLTGSPTTTAPKANDQIGTSYTFAWNAVTSPQQVTYQVQIATDNQFNGTISLPPGGPNNVNGYTTATSMYVQNLVPGQQYYLRVSTASPLPSKWSTTVPFVVKLGVTNNQNLAGVNGNSMSPAPGAVGVPVNTAFQWSAVTGADSYHIQVSDNPGFTSPIADATTKDTFFTLSSALKPGTIYYWRVQAVSGSISSDYVSNVFTTAAPVTAPTSTGPAAPAQTVQPTIIVTVPPQTAPPVSTPAYIWVIIAIGAVLVIAVVVLIARTRRV